MGLLASLKTGLKRTRENLNLSQFLRGKNRLNQEFLEELEEILYQGDLGVEATESLLDALRQRAGKVDTGGDLKEILRQEMVKLFPENGAQPMFHQPEVILLTGVNGCGKTTTAGKLAHNYVQSGKKVVLAAADTFRAAAIEQLELWAERAGARLVKQSHGADAASVAFDALQSAIAKDDDVLIIDTAGRLQSKSNLMNELEKIRRVLKKLIPEAPHQNLLVLDAIIGQNAMSQAEVFKDRAGVDGLILTKLDGTARGGSAFAVSRRFELPIRYVGVGEKIDDLLPFEPDRFVKELLG